MRNATIDALLEKGLIHERDGVLLETVTYLPDDGSSIDDKLNTIKSMSSSEHGVIVVAWPKTGNHFLMAILDALGVPRVEDVPRKSGVTNINGKLFEAETELGAYSRMETKMAEATGPIMLPHTHVWPCHFMRNFKGKILMVKRNPKSVALSAYHFLKQIAHYRRILEEYYNVTCADDFGQLMARGEFFWGESDDFNQQWAQFARDNAIDMLVMNFEDIIADKAAYIEKIAAFVGITTNKLDMDTIIGEIELERVIEKRRAKFENANLPFREIICYRSGKTDSYRDEFSAETVNMFRVAERKY